MNIFNTLATSSIVNSFGVEPIASIDLNWIGNIISWIFDLFSGFYGAVALGVIVFTLCLKTLVLPLDIYSRVKTKKQSLLMERMRPQMEKLQKQYANDKTMYQQKVSELQKAHGYNPLGACLPMIVSLVIFMVVFSSFSTYSNYATLRNYNEMVDAYNASVGIYVQTDDGDTDNSHFLIGSDNSYKVDFDKFKAHYSEYCRENEKTFDEAAFDAKDENAKWEVVTEYVQINAREAVVEWYAENKTATEFAWIGNMWYPDSMLNKKVPDYASFSSSVSRAIGSGASTTYEDDYNEVTYNLTAEKGTYNGYFVLIVLSIGLMFAQQFISMRSQKAANELSSVDGSAAKTNKWMMIMMPIIFGVFSFFYSAAFSIYMIVNTLYGLISMLIINKAVAVSFAKKGDAIFAKKGKPSDKAKRLR
ncbi:MAG: YidC/Oxa1 family membrane protein insertase [Clostridia bacterium]|nr:YidC/Oxa1 family membrane protein insertase [Clostridia bacterium]